MTKIVYILTLFFILFACQDNHEIVNRKKIYNDQCLSCHNYKNSVDDDKTTLLNMSRYDSTNLLKKLQSINSNETHKNYFNNEAFAEAEIKALFTHIKMFSGPVAD